jgi:hypothetical protein
MVLKGGMEVGHGGMPGIAGLREQTEVGKPETPDQTGICSKHPFRLQKGTARMEHEGRKEDDSHGDKG